MRLREQSYPFRRSNEADKSDFAGSFILQDGYSRGRTPSGREHWIENENERAMQFGWKLQVIIHGPERHFISVQSDVSHARIGQHFNKSSHQTESCTKYRH